MNRVQFQAGMSLPAFAGEAEGSAVQVRALSYSLTGRISLPGVRKCCVLDLQARAPDVLPVLWLSASNHVARRRPF